MRGRAVALCVVIAVVVATPAAAKGWRPGVGRAVRYLQTRSGNVTFAVKSPAGKLFAYEGRTRVAAASVMKAMFMATYLRQGSVRNRHLTDDDKALLAPMIRRSDNTTATRIADQVGAERIYRLARDAGMRDFSYTRPWGLSQTSAVDQARFFFHYERYLPRRHEGYARYLLAHVVAEQRWGIGQINRPKWKIFFKGGWGSGTGAVCHQAAFLERKGLRISAAVMITSSPSHAYATETLRGMFKRLLRRLPKPYQSP